MASEMHTDLTKMYVSIEVLSQKLDEIIKIYKQQQNVIVNLRQRLEMTEQVENETYEINDKSRVQSFSPAIDCEIPWF